MMINEHQIFELINNSERVSKKTILSVINKGLDKKGLSLEEVSLLINVKDDELIQELFNAAAKIKQDIYGSRLVLFAPLYISNFCINNCQYCNFKNDNKDIKRKKLTLDEIKAETKALIDMGHKRVLIEFGEDPDNSSIDYVCDAINAIYSVKTNKGNIRRINVNIAATTTQNYKKLKQAQIGTYQLFQETFHKETYESIHNGPKADFERQLLAHKNAFDAGIDDLGIGVLFGLYDWKYDLLSLLQYANWMNKELRVGPHTISIPRLRPIKVGNEGLSSSGLTRGSNYLVSDSDFLKIIAIFRIAVPYTGIILSTRESSKLRQKAFNLGVSQASAASSTTPGGYYLNKDSGQFEIQDKRPLNEFIKSAIEQEIIPSFCTACYRSKRTGENFMDLAKAGDIHEFCYPNAILTLAEYLTDYADDKTKQNGFNLIEKSINQISNQKIKKLIQENLQKISLGQRDLYL